MRKMICVRRCHGFRGGTWDREQTVDVADGEDVPRHFIPIEEWEDFVQNENSPKAKTDTMKPVPNTSPVPTHLQGRGGLSTVKPADFGKPGAVRPGSDI